MPQNYNTFALFDPPKKGDLIRVSIQILKKIHSPPSPKMESPWNQGPTSYKHGRAHFRHLPSPSVYRLTSNKLITSEKTAQQKTRALTSTLVGLPASPDKILQLGFGPSSKPKTHRRD